MPSLSSHPAFIALIASTALLVVSSGCDTAEVETQDAHLAGVHHVADGAGVDLSVRADGLHLDAPLGGRLTVETSGADHADVYFHLAGIADGSVFASEVVDRDGRSLARLAQRRRADAYETTATWPAGTGATLEALDDGHIVYSAPLTGPTAPLGVTSDVATSKHYTENGHIVYDFERTGSDGRTVYTPPDSSRATYEVTHLRVALAGGLPRDVAAVRFTAPAGSGLTVLRERFSLVR